MFIDTHSHLDTFPEGERDAVIRRARDSGVDLLVTIGAGHGREGNSTAVDLARSHECVYAAVGVHPHDASAFVSSGGNGLADLARSPKVVAVGETGLDFYRMTSPREDQVRAFVAHIRLALELRLPVIVHCRDAYPEALDILRREGAGDHGGILHCFSGDGEAARRALDMGFYLSVAGNVTFKNAGRLREVVREIPIERILLETDCPYLAPEPVRGKRNEPSYLTHTAARVAEIKGLTVEDVARVTTANARKVFRLPEAAKHGKIAYPIRRSLYLNITNRCTNACVFCPKFTDYMVKGHYLRLGPEPSLEEILGALPADLSGYQEVVFCGFGESTLRLDVLTETARRLKERNMRVRLDTDGLGNLVHGRNIVPDLAGLIDCVSVSLNAADAATYARICPSTYGERAYGAVKDFIRAAKASIPEVVATVVAMPGIDVEECRRIAETELGVGFRARAYNQVG